MLETAPGNIIHCFIPPLNVPSFRMKAADFCLDFLPFSKGSMKPDTKINTDLEAPERAGELHSCFKINSLLT